MGLHSKLHHVGEIWPLSNFWLSMVQMLAFRVQSVLYPIKRCSFLFSGGKYGTALQAAAASYEEKNLAIVKFLLEHGADVNIQGAKCLISN